ncbi:hypothetical protein HDF16_005665 [Granulicella aggregans]|uniref:Uncharacterized protein n=1 Tax=Granulicella aggregans TaxID=474949 RepID=A0A7W7ZJY2_9BACT|nr:hypothetical protein [Granulicella aggregans]MBB5060929.1 hypothetical protein [Granulicella aggregans]
MPEITFGSHQKIMFVRAIQVLLLAVSALMHPQAAESLWSWLVYIPLAAALFGLSRVVFARITVGGLEYLRFGKPVFVGWAEVDKATVNSLGQITVQLSGRSWWTRYLLLLRPSKPLAGFAPGNPDAARLIELCVR